MVKIRKKIDTLGACKCYANYAIVLNREERDLVDFAWRMHVKVVDGRMGSLVNLEQAIRVLHIGLLCTLNESKDRPSMEEVVEFLGRKANSRASS